MSSCLCFRACFSRKVCTSAVCLVLKVIRDSQGSQGTQEEAFLAEKVLKDSLDLQDIRLELPYTECLWENVQSVSKLCSCHTLSIMTQAKCRDFIHNSQRFLHIISSLNCLSIKCEVILLIDFHIHLFQHHGQLIRSSRLE